MATREKQEILRNSSAIYGQVYGDIEENDSIIVAIYKDNSGKKDLVNYQYLPKTGWYTIILPGGSRYFVIAFNDRNDNFFPDQNESSGVCGEKGLIEVSEQDALGSACNIHISYKNRLPDDYLDAINTSNIILPEAKPQFWCGKIADLNNPIFSKKYGKKGLKNPLKFLEEVGVGIYFLEPYDKNKIPVLFISGAGGYPQQWLDLLSIIDRDKFQPWFFNYPSGWRIAPMGKVLNLLINSLHENYHFEKLLVTAHSMGGLLARSFILDNIHDSGHDYIKGLITISTPWNGHQLAFLGVHLSPIIIPSWIDMQTNSEFQKTIFKRKFGSKVKHYLIFTYGGRNLSIGAYNNGAVSIESQLQNTAQEDTYKTFGFNEEHTRILRNPEMLNLYNKILGNFIDNDNNNESNI